MDDKYAEVAMMVDVLPLVKPMRATMEKITMQKKGRHGGQIIRYGHTRQTMKFQMNLLSRAILTKDLFTLLWGLRGLLPIEWAKTKLGKLSACFTSLLM